MYKTMLILTLTLTLASLACLETTVAMQSEILPTQTAMPATEPDSGAVYIIPEISTPEPALATCAIVTAIQSLNLREQPSEKSIVITWLHAFEQVTIISKAGDWWKVETDTHTGYAKADYLQESECK